MSRTYSFPPFEPGEIPIAKPAGKTSLFGTAVDFTRDRGSLADRLYDAGPKVRKRYERFTDPSRRLRPANALYTHDNLSKALLEDRPNIQTRLQKVSAATEKRYKRFVEHINNKGPKKKWVEKAYSNWQSGQSKIINPSATVPSGKPLIETVGGVISGEAVPLTRTLGPYESQLGAIGELGGFGLSGGATAAVGDPAGKARRALEVSARRARATKSLFDKSFAGKAAKMGKGMWGFGKGAAGRGAGIVSAFSNPWVGGGLIAAGLLAGVAGGIFAGLSGSRPQRQTPAGYATQTMGAGYPTFFASHGPMSSTNLSTGGLTQALYNTRKGQH